MPVPKLAQDSARCQCPHGAEQPPAGVASHSNEQEGGGGASNQQIDRAVIE